MTDETKLIHELILENGKLRAALAAALDKQTNKPCRSCARLERHDCYTLWRCPILGIVDPERDGCQIWKERTNGNKAD